MDIDKIRNQVANDILHLFEHTNKTPRLNIYDKDKLIRDIGSVKSKEQLVLEIQNRIGEAYNIDPDAFEENRILVLTAPIDRNNTKENINKVRENMQQIQNLTELKELSGQKIREPEEPEETVQYRFLYVYH